MKQVNVFLATGLGDELFSDGIPDLEERLFKYRGKGIDYISTRHYSQYADVRDRLRRYRDPSVLIGHSFGWRALMLAAREAGVTVPLAICCDASQKGYFTLGGAAMNRPPANVLSVDNYYQPKEWYLFFTSIGGVKLNRDDGSERGITQYLMPKESHVSIDNAKLFQDGAIMAIESLIERINT